MAASVNRRLLALTGLLLVSVAAMSMAAATLTTATGGTSTVDSRVVPDPVSSNGTSGQQDGNVSQVDLGDETSTAQTIQLAGCNDLLASVPGGFAYFGGMVGALYLVKRRFSLGALIFAFYAIVPAGLAVYFLRTDCVQTGGPSGTGGGGGIGSALSSAPATPNVPAPVLLGVFVVLFVGVAAAVFFTSGERENVSEEDDESVEAEADVEEIARAAGEAAERLESRNADVDNEVYRAWWELTQLLDLSNPETHTPGEFAEAAVEAGIDREYVAPLTTLFEEVRYGHEDPESREEQAIEVFRAIESEYGDGPTSTDDGSAVDGSPDSDDATDGTTADDTTADDATDGTPAGDAMDDTTADDAMDDTEEDT